MFPVKQNLIYPYNIWRVALQFQLFRATQPSGFWGRKIYPAWKFCSFFSLARLFGLAGVEKSIGIFCGHGLPGSYTQARAKNYTERKLPRWGSRASFWSTCWTEKTPCPLAKKMPQNPLGWVVQNSWNCNVTIQIALKALIFLFTNPYPPSIIIPLWKRRPGV